MTTMKDVAKTVGVSLGTVSNVLNGREVVQDETRLKVLQVMKQLNYVPNSVARALKTNRTQIIGIMLPSITNPFYATIARVADDVVQNLGYTLLISNTDRNPNREFESAKALLEKGVDGIIWIAKSMRFKELSLELNERLPILYVDSELNESEGDQLSVDNYQGGALAAEHLYQLGHRKIAVIEGPKEAKKSWNRIPGFYNKLLEHGISIEKNLIRIGNFEFDSGYDYMRSLLKEDSEFTALFAANDMMAVGAITAAREAGLKVPDDLSVVGFDDIMLAQYFDPALSTVRQPAEQLGRFAVEMLMKRINDPGIPHKYEVLPTEFIPRKSSRFIGSV